MGYESKIIVADVHRRDTWTFTEIIAEVNMSKMGGFSEIFTQPIDYKLYVNDEKSIDKDEYDEHLRSCDIETVRDWLKTVPKEEGWEDYERLKPLEGLLSAIDKEDWEEIQIVHYGY